MNVIIFAVQVIVLGLVQLAGILSGLLIVPIMLIFGRFDKASSVPFTNYPGIWTKEVFPRVFWPWDNREDSSVGDTRGWWHANSFGADAYKLINRFWWLAIRNPFNNFKRYVIGIDVRNYSTIKLAGQLHVRDDFYHTGWQWLKAEKKSFGFPRYMFYGVWRYGFSNRALVIQIGNKIKVEHNHTVEENELDYWKGFTIEFNPFKDIS